MNFRLDEDQSSELPTPAMKACVKCGVEKSELLFRTYGRGRRSTCIECENLIKPAERVEETPDILNIKSSLGFSVGIVNEDTYLITQKVPGQETPMLIRLQPHEAVALIDWMKVRLYPEEEE